MLDKGRKVTKKTYIVEEDVGSIIFYQARKDYNKKNTFKYAFIEMILFIFCNICFILNVLETDKKYSIKVLKR